MSAKVKTTGDLRDFLAEIMTGVVSGSVDVDAARTAVKMAAQINESFYSEVKVQRTIAEAGGFPRTLGDLSLGNPNAVQK